MSQYLEYIHQNVSPDITINSPNTCAAILEYVDKNPGCPTKDIENHLVRTLGLGSSSIYRALKICRKNNLITEHNRLTKPINNRDFPIPAAIKQGQLISKHPAVHLVAYLAKFQDEEVVPPYNKTKKHIINSIRKTIADDVPLSMSIVASLQTSLALCSLVASSTNQWMNMLGTMTPPDTIEEIFNP